MFLKFSCITLVAPAVNGTTFCPTELTKMNDVPSLSPNGYSVDTVSFDGLALSVVIPLTFSNLNSVPW